MGEMLSLALFLLMTKVSDLSMGLEDVLWKKKNESKPKLIVTDKDLDICKAVQEYSPKSNTL